MVPPSFNTPPLPLSLSSKCRTPNPILRNYTAMSQSTESRDNPFIKTVPRDPKWETTFEDLPRSIPAPTNMTPCSGRCDT